MAVPTLPSDKSAGNDWDETDTNLIYDHLQWWRDTRPLFKGAGVTVTNLASGTEREFGFGTSSGTFATTPAINVGSWSVATTTNTASEYNVEVPEAGIYYGVWKATIEANTGGSRQMQPQLNGSDISLGAVVTGPALGGSATTVACPFMVDCAADDELSLDFLQNSGSALDVTGTSLICWWVQST